MFGQGFNYGFLGKPLCFTDTTDIFKDNSGVALYTLDYDASAADGGGKFGEAAKFNNTNSYIELPSTIDDPMRSGSAFTVSLWYKHAAQTNSYGGAIMKLLNNIYNLIDVETNGTIRARVLSSSAVTSEVTSSALTVGDWYHIVWTGNTASGVSLYINNSLVGNTAWNGTFYTYTDSNYKYNRLGYQNQSVASLVGEIDQVRFFNRLVTSTEVSTLYNESKETTNTLQILGDSSCYATYTLNNNVNDLSGNYNATSSNLVYTNINGTPTNVDFGVGGKSLYGARFNGTNSYIYASSSVQQPTTNFSVSCWVNFDTIKAASVGVIGNFKTGVTPQIGWAIAHQSGTPFQFWADGTASSNGAKAQGTTNPVAGIWYNIVGTYDGTNIKIYVNGSLEGTTAYSATPAQTDQPLVIGRWYGNYNDHYTDGKIDQVRIFNKALSVTEISKLYGNGAGEIACKYTATTSNIAYPIVNTTYYKLDNNSKDSASSTGKFGKGGLFNGSSSFITISGNMLNSLTAISASAWVYRRTGSSDNYEYILSGGISVSGQRYGIAVNDDGGSGDNKFYITDGASSFHTNTICNYNTWYHVVYTWSGTELKFYVNGSLDSTFTAVNCNFQSSGNGHKIGEYHHNGNYEWSGSIDQVRIFNKAISSSEVTTLYNETSSTVNTLQILGDTSCIATYTLEGNANDLSANYNGTASNVVYAYDGTETDIEYRFGRYGQAAVFNGSTSQITTSYTTNDSAFTISGWIKHTSTTFTSKYHYLAAKGYYSSASNTNYWYLANYNNANPEFRVRLNSSDVTATSSVAMNLNQWHHLAATLDSSGNMKIYLDGILTGSATGAPARNTSQGINFGTFSGVYHHDGQIDQIRYYPSVLDADAIQNLYNEKPETDTSNFKTVLYEGTGATQYISNVGMDLETGGGLVWLKRRNTSSDHYLVDSVRGNGNDTYKNLSSNTNNTEGTTTSSGIINNAFEANGFIMQGSGARTNANGSDYVAWNWKGSGFQPSQTFSNIKTQGLIAHWNATQNDSLYPGSTWYDLTSNNNDLTHYKTSVSNISISRNNGGAIDMNSTRQFYTLQFINDQTFTIGGWYRRDAFGSAGYENLWSQGYAPSVRLQVYGSGGASTGDRIYHYVHNGSSGNTYNTGIDTPKGVWFHIMVTYDFSNGTVKLYLNGSLVHTESTITGSIYSGSNSDAYFRVARNSTNANGYINGAISQIRVYSDVLTAAEVLNDYNATKNLFQTNNNGTISATVDANQNAGFSIVKYTGNGTAGATVGHGLSAKPQFILFKNLDTVVSWIAYDTINNVIGYLDNTDSLTDGRRAWAVNNTDPTNTLVTLGNNQATNAASNFIMYCWHSVAGYSSIGSYEGNGTTRNVNLGFDPSWIMIKNIDAGSTAWNIVDTRRDTDTTLNLFLQANTNIAEANTTICSLITNGFSVTGTNTFNNSNGHTFLYMAFK